MNYFAVEFGSYQVRVAHERISLDSPIVLSHQFLTWLCYAQEKWLVGDIVEKYLYDYSQIPIHYDFFKTQDSSLKLFTKLNKKLISYIFQLQPEIKQAKVIVAVIPSFWGTKQNEILQKYVGQYGVDIAATISSIYAKALYLANRSRMNAGDIFAVYEWGASQFEFAVFQVSVKQALIKIECLASAGFETGSYQWDHYLWELVAQKYKQQRGKELTIKKLSPLDRQINTTRQSLNQSFERAIHIWGGFICSITQLEFKEKINSDLNRSLQCIQNVLTQANLSKQTIKKIYVTGGNSQSIFIQEFLESYFVKSQLSFENEMDIAAKGAVIYAQYPEIIQKKIENNNEITAENGLEEISEEKKSPSKNNSDLFIIPEDNLVSVADIKDKQSIFLKGKYYFFIVIFLVLSVAIVTINLPLQKSSSIFFAEECSKPMRSTTSILIDQNTKFSHEQKKFILRQIIERVEKHKAGELIGIYALGNNLPINFCKPSESSNSYPLFKSQFEQKILTTLQVEKTKDHAIAESIQKVMKNRQSHKSKHQKLWIFSDFSQHSASASIQTCTEPMSAIEQFKNAQTQNSKRPKFNNIAITLYVAKNSDVASLHRQQCWHSFWLWFLGDLKGDSLFSRKDF